MCQSKPDNRNLFTGVRWNGNNLREVIMYTGLHPSVAHLDWEQYEQLVENDGLKIFTLNGAERLNIGDLIAWIDDDLKVLRNTGIWTDDDLKVLRNTGITILPDTTTEFRLSALNDGNVSIHRMDTHGELKLHAICYTAQELYDFIKDTRQQFNATVI